MTDTEIEASFTNIDKDQVRASLKKLGAQLLQPERLMKRRVFHPVKKINDWFRVRDEGHRITMSYKKVHQRSLDGVTEITVEVDDFEAACRLLEKTAVHSVAYQETRRESWVLKGVEIEIDEWPWIPPFVEIEGESEKEVRQTAEVLGFAWPEALFGSVENIYQQYYQVTEEEVDSWPEITFTPVPDWLAAKRLRNLS